MKPKKKHKSQEDMESKSVNTELEEVKQTLQSLEHEKEELLGKLQRVSADYANFQKRVPKQVADSIAYEKERILKSVLPVLDNFEHTLNNARSAEDFDVLVKGVRIIYDQMLDVLKSHGVEQVVSVGEKFDPARHEAMMRKTDENEEEDVVLEEFQKGYRLNERVLRPSKVIVNKVGSSNAGMDAAGNAEQPNEEGEEIDQIETPTTEE